MMTGSTMVRIILLFIVVVNGIFAIQFIRDFLKNKAGALKEPGHSLFLAGWSVFVFFFSTFGVSDFALSTVVYRAKKLIPDRKLPGTLNAQCVVPVAVMALAYIAVISVDALTLILCIIAQVSGAYIGPGIVVKLPVKIIRRFIGTGLVIAALFVAAGKAGILPVGGAATALTGSKLIAAIIALFIFGALNNIGIGSYAPTMATVYALGMSPAVAFPIMMGACTFSVPIGSMEFIRFGQYGRKITLFASTFGIIGVLVAVYVVKSLNVSMLQWVIAAVVLYAGLDILIKELRTRHDAEPVTR
jgi:uncharacterized membrane protein YfcA